MAKIILYILLAYPDGHHYELTMPDTIHHSCRAAEKDVRFQLEETLSVAWIEKFTCEERT